MRPSPRTVPITTRIAGVMRLFSNEYFTRNTIPRKRTNPPIQAKSFTPKNASQSNGLDGTRGGGGGMSGGGAGGGATGFGGGATVWIGVASGATGAAFGTGGGMSGTAAFGSTTDGAGSATGPRDSNAATR